MMAQKGTLAATVSALAIVGTASITKSDRLFVDVAVTGAALTAFEVWGRGHPNAAFHKLLATTTDYTQPDGTFLLWSSGNISIQGTSGSGGMLLDVRGFSELQFKAAGNSSVVTIRKGA